MRRLACGFLLVSSLVLVASAMADTPATEAFTRLRALEGEWEGAMPDGKPTQVTYRIVSSGTCVMETLDTPDGSNMVTIYRVNGRSLLMDHYCSMGNQPRMRATPAAGAHTLDFGFVSATGLASPNAPHMHHFTLRFDDDEHLTHEWTLRSGKKDERSTFHFTRKH